MIMDLEVILFAIYKERLKTNSIIVQLPESSTVEQLVNKLKNDYPQLADPETNIVVAVNSEYSEYNLKLNETDEICLIPPVSGG
ncbi:MAG: MoaD/ThiS family protein [SAR202 cluster bacterium]|jgi:molybdopterin converting factor subunit 1|nr:MoaD/ThiS family protein [SAR202 cluster bacterium]MQG53331.1 MoaD/ThiS family protein [SAR202 cluster bacterium]MQG60575.1 MoaD/ThiS family protein [SAR202 cluster bacterium]CAI8263339.1 MAG: Molybdopterin synthase sulfur carrier subunit [Chloroflexota bacterium]|tara:strand:+ start:1290 stop:1541 length:252 start_codon:yes stop_codon:yes gene_type:complete